jgi:hypothetical protein
MMRRLLDALLLKGLWKFKPIHVIAFWLFMSYQGWMASPYFMYYVVGAPEPGTAPRYVGTIRVEGKLQRTNNGWIPPRYFIVTDKDEVEFHCGYLPYKNECVSIGRIQRQYPELIFELGVDSYWGIDFVKFPPPYTHFDEYYQPKAVIYGRKLDLHGYTRHSRHFWAGLWFCLGLGVYLLLVIYKLWPESPPRPPRIRQPGDVPTEAEIAEQLRIEEVAAAQKPTDQQTSRVLPRR